MIFAEEVDRVPEKLERAQNFAPQTEVKNGPVAQRMSHYSLRSSFRGIVAEVNQLPMKGMGLPQKFCNFKSCRSFIKFLFFLFPKTSSLLCFKPEDSPTLLTILGH